MDYRMTKKEKIKIELDRIPRREFMPGSCVYKIGYKYIHWYSRGIFYKSTIDQFYDALFNIDINIYQLINDV